MPSPLAAFLGLAVGLLVAIIAWLVAGGRERRRAAGSMEAERTARVEAETGRAAAEARSAELASAREEAVLTAGSERELRAKAERESAAGAASLEAERRNVAEQRKLLDDARERLRDVFAAVGGEELRKAQEQLVQAAREVLGGQHKLAQQDLEARQAAILESLKPVREILDRQGRAIADIELKREGAYAALVTQLEGMARATEAVRSEAGRLSQALRRSDARGRWGETALRNIVEMAGMTEHVDFDTQVQHGGGGDPVQRPDLTIRLPGGGVVVVDAKVPLEKFLDAQERPEQAAALLLEHAAALKRHVDSLARKDYSRQFALSPSYVIMFVPVESALAAALAADPELQTHALESRVIVASSGIFLALLQTIALFWRQESITRNAAEIAAAGRELYGRLAKFAEHLAKVGKSIEGAGEHYNKMIGSLESQVLPSARRLAQLKAAEPSAEMPEIPTLTVESKPITKTELLPAPTGTVSD